MHEEFDKEVLYEQDDKIKRKHKKLVRKLFLVILGLFFVIYIPNFLPKYSDFDVVHNALFFQMAIYIIMIYVLYIFLRFYRLPETIELKYRKSFKLHSDLFDLSSFLVFLMVVFVFINTFLFSLSNVQGGSMEPTLFDQDDVVIWHFSGDYERFDIVIVRINEDEYYIKRIIGLPNDEVVYNNDRLFINGELIEESFILDSSFTCETVCYFLVPDNHYFVLGDSRRNSKDSRSDEVGFIPYEDLYGRAIFIIRPFERFGKVD